MPYVFDHLFAADESNPANVARNTSITLFVPGDATMTPVTGLTKIDGQPYPNPITVNANGYAPQPVHQTLDRLAWSGGGFTGVMTAYESMKEEAVAARAAAETAAADAAASAAAEVQARIAAGEFKGERGADGANVLPTDTAIKNAITTPGTETATALSATIDTQIEGSDYLPERFARRREINVADYGAVGDWNGATGTDNLAAFNAAAAAAAASGAPSRIVIGPGDYRLSNNWLLDGENVEVECDAETTIRTTTATTTGAAVTFMGHGVLSPNAVNTPQRERFNWRGGRIIATGSGTADNALGVVRVKNCHIANLTLDADRKALTAQYGIDNIIWERIVVTRAGTDAVTVETQCKRATLRDIHVVSTTGVGVLVTSGDAGARCSDVLLDNVNVDSAATGVSLGLTDRLTIRKTRVAAASTQGFYVSEVSDLSVSGDTSFPSVNIGANVTYKKPRKVTPALSNGWVAYGAPFGTPGAMRTTDGMVEMEGAVKSGTLTSGTLIATLPVGYRPSERQAVLALSAGGASNAAYLYIEPVGATNPGGIFAGAAIPSSVLLSFSGLRFPVA